jgi:hypothetical protein
MTPALVPLFVSLVGVSLPSSHPVHVRAAAVEVAIVRALEVEGVPVADRPVWLVRLWGWSFWESSWRVDALGDAGTACGLLQVHDPGVWLPGATCASVRADPVLGVRAGLRVMRYAIGRCGSVASGLGMFASGRCGWVAPLVARRCRLLGDPC